MKKHSILEQIAKLIDLKSILTISLIAALIVGFMQDKITSEAFLPIVATIVAYYFTKKDKGDSNG